MAHLKKSIVAQLIPTPVANLITNLGTRHTLERLGGRLNFFKNGPTPASFIVYFWSFQTNIITIFTTNICENVHPVYGARIQTHDLWNVSLLP